MLRGSIEDCQALIHIAGLRYGAEPNPDTLPAGTPRRSYTQIECHVGCQLHAERGDTGFRVYGEKGGLEWHQREPNTLLVKWPDQPMQVWRTANGDLGAAALAAGRTPPAHPEGYLEAFANIYQAFAATLRARLEKRKPTPLESDYPKITDGLRGMAFIEAVVASSKKNAAWTKLDA